MMNENIRNQSNITTLINIINKYLDLAYIKQKIILDQDFTKLNKISIEQKEISIIFDNAIKEVSNNKINNPDKEKIKKLLNEYRDIEKINTKMLNDSLFAAKHKAEKLFNLTNFNDTYKMNEKKVSKLWNDAPFVLNEFI